MDRPSNDQAIAIIAKTGMAVRLLNLVVAKFDNSPRTLDGLRAGR